MREHSRSAFKTRSILAAVGTTLLVALSGCTREMYRPGVAGDVLPEGTPVALDVISAGSNIRVFADQRVDAPDLVARARGARRDVDDAPADLSWVDAELVQSVNGYTLRLRVDPVPGVDPEAGPATVTLRVPAITDVYARVQDGYIHISGPTGAIDIEADDDIRVRTDDPVTEPVSMRSDAGQVTISVPPESVGILEVSAPAGIHTLYTPVGVSVTGYNPRPAEGVTLAVLNRNTSNAIRLHSTKGGARINVVNEPMKTSFLQPFIETSPD